MAKPARPIIDRIADRVALTESGCLIWTGSLDGGGYGHISVGSKVDGTKRHAKLHRLLYELSVGPIPDGLDIDHLCRTRACCLPDHLEPVTRRENLLRGQTLPAANVAKTHCAQGHPYAGDNLYVNPNNGRRGCRACGAACSRRRKARLRGEAA